MKLPSAAWYSQPIPTTPVPDGAPLGHPSLYFNRELSDIAFNRRVLWQAADERTPLLERVRFLAITAGNLDEFFQKRVGGLKRQQAAGVTSLSPDGLTPGEQLDLVLAASRDLMSVGRRLWRERLVPELKGIGVEILEYDDLSATERELADAHFEERVYPVLTPLAVDPTRPFPLISNLSLSLAVTLVDAEDGTERFARVKVPSGRERWVRFPGSRRVIPLERLVARHIGTLFPGMQVTGAYPFSIIRNAFLEHHADVADDLIAMISEALREQRFAPVVRFDVETGTPAAVCEFLRDQLEVGEEDVFYSDALLRAVDLHHLVVDRDPEHTYAPWVPVEHERLAHRPLAPESGAASDIFSVLKQGDILVHHPYQSYDTSVLRLLHEAADDPAVVAIKQTLYRTADESQVVRALMHAAERGKQVSVLIEIQARFEERANIGWGEALEDVGVHVAYGVPHLKTHAKSLLVLRRERGGIVGYCHVGTGNYNERTAQIYSDLSLLTSREEVAGDLVNLFHSLTGFAPDQQYEKLLVAPRNMAARFEELIQGEIDRQAAHGDGRIIAKMNGLDDVDIVNALYRASQAGVRCDLIVRGLCRLRPGLPGYSENITVRSILGRFLEHDRSFYFHQGGEGAVYIGSADWRRRNLRERVEVVVPVEDPVAKARIVESLHLALADNRLGWELAADGSYVQLRPPAGGPEIEYQRDLMARALR
ncbi:MAG: polyphosphate kinase 1 [Trueperaceae bacterium]|nr:polyphosphate kinase 1 [Trueperaceae bacterium]